MKHKFPSVNKKIVGGNRIIYCRIAIRAITLNSRQNTNRVLPVYEPGMPLYNLAKSVNVQQRVTRIWDVIDWLDVENSIRFRPDGKTTFCNIYAYDVACLLGAYIPRLWWHEGALKKLLKGVWQEALYGETVFEQNCNALTTWFYKYAFCFGWVRVFDITKLQTEVNKGTIGLIVAKNRNMSESGHIVVIVPETKFIKARWEEGRVMSPLQSQAGVRNSKYDTGYNWWENEKKFISVSFWYWKIRSC